VIDELLVTLGLDSTKFKNEARQTQSTINQVGAGAVKQSKELEEGLKKQQTETHKRLVQTEQVGRSTYQAFNKLRLEVLALFSTLAVGAGIQSFIKNMTVSEAGLGRLSKAIGNISTEDLAAFEQASERMGGSADAAGSSLLGFSQAVEKMNITGEPAPFLPWLRQMHIDLADVDKRARPTMDILNDLHNWFATHKGPQAFAAGSALGFDAGTVNLLSSDKYQEALNQVKQLGVTSEEDSKRGQEFIETLHDFEQTLTRLGQVIANDYLKDINDVLKAMTGWITANREWLKADIEDKLTKAIDVVRQFLAAVREVVDAVGGWKDAIEIVFGLWAATKVAPILTAIGSIAAAMTALGVETKAVGLLFGGLPGLIAGAALALGGMVWDDERIKKHNLEHPEDPIETWYGMMSRMWQGGKSFLGQHFGGASDERQADVRDQLSQRLGISKQAASGVVSNLNAESGIRGINEVNPTVPGSRGGFGWAQWTGPRRDEFEAYAGRHQLDPASDEANMGFLIEELTTKYPQILAQLRRGDISAYEAADIVARGYIIPPADKIAGHISGAEGLARLPSPAHTSPIMGDSAARVPTFDPALSDLLRTPTAAASIANNDNSRSVNQTSEVHTGPISIHVAHGDPDSIARGVGASLRKYAFVSTANVGLA